MKHKIIDKLHGTDGFVSGEKLSEEFGLSRTAIWKHVNALKEDGYVIESVTRRGYRLVSSPDLVNHDEVKELLDTRIIGREIIHFDSIESTNKTAKEIANEKPEGTVVVAEEQTGGKGRLGRSWISPSRKGLYFSVILKPKADPTTVAKLTLLGAAAVNLALRDMGIESQIKWPNDIVVGGKKTTGILTEMNCELGTINHIVLGIGINVNQPLDQIPEELREKATSLLVHTGKPVARKELFAALLNHLDNLYGEFVEKGSTQRSIDICRENSAVIGKEVLVIQGDKRRVGQAIGINQNGELQVRFETGLEVLYSGEVSIRGKDSYI